MRRILLGLIAAVALAGAARAQTFNDIKWYTEDYAPFSFIGSDGKVTGIAIDVLVEVFKRTGSKTKASDIKLGAWDVGYNAALKGPNACIFSTVRSKARENLFKWVGPVGATQTAVTAKKAKGLKIKSAADLKGLKATVIKDDSGHQAAIKAGIPEANLILRTSFDDCIKDVESGAADVVIREYGGAMYSLKKAGLIDKYEIVYVLDKTDLMYALSKDLPDSVIEEFQNAIDEIKIDGDYVNITNKYMK